jgi:hypothetical protein
VVEVVAGLLEGFEDWLEASGGLDTFSGFLSGSFFDTSAGRPRPLGVVGVFGNGDLVGETFDAMAAFVVDIGAGLSVGFPAVLVAAAGFEVPFVWPFEVAAPAVFAEVPVFFNSAFAFGAPNFLSFSSEGISIADSGIVSSITELFFLVSNSAAIDSFFARVAFGLSSSSMLKLVLRFAMLGSPLLSLRSCKPICPLFSTVTKLVLILDSGRGDVPLLATPRGY